MYFKQRREDTLLYEKCNAFYLSRVCELNNNVSL